MPIFTTASAEYTLPVNITYTCGKCGKDVSTSETVYVGATIGGTHLSTKDAEELLRTSMPSDTQKQLQRISDYWEKGALTPCDQLSTKMYPSIQIRCPYCRLRQIPNAGGKLTQVKDRGMTIPRALYIVIVIGWMIGMFVSLFKHPVNPWNFLYITLACLIAGICVFFCSKAASKRILADPSRLENKYQAVLNDAVYADFTPYGLTKILINSK